MQLSQQYKHTITFNTSVVSLHIQKESSQLNSFFESIIFNDVTTLFVVDEYDDHYSPDEDEDEPMQYWSSEHHRFDYSNLNPILEEFDLTSYHQMGIAVPGTFVDDSKSL